MFVYYSIRGVRGRGEEYVLASNQVLTLYVGELGLSKNQEVEPSSSPSIHPAADGRVWQPRVSPVALMDAEIMAGVLEYIMLALTGTS